MPDSSSTIYLVTGATRGIGLALVADVVSKDPTAIIYAGGRNLIDAAQLTELAAKHPGRIYIVKYVAGDKEGNEQLASQIREEHGRVDMVIANAGVANFMGKVHDTPAQKYEEHFSVNVVGTIVLFHSIRDLLKASLHPRFVAISSGAGSIENIALTTFDLGAYATSKTALNWVVRKIHFENEWLVAYPHCPGPVSTVMAKVSFEENSSYFDDAFKNSFREPGEAASMLIDAARASTREKDGGQFHNIDGGRTPW